jgi:hypothetical protein
VASLGELPARRVRLHQPYFTVFTKMAKDESLLFMSVGTRFAPAVDLKAMRLPSGDQVGT